GFGNVHPGPHGGAGISPGTVSGHSRGWMLFTFPVPVFTTVNRTSKSYPGPTLDGFGTTTRLPCSGLMISVALTRSLYVSTVGGPTIWSSPDAVAVNTTAPLVTASNRHVNVTLCPVPSTAPAGPHTRDSCPGTLSGHSDGVTLSTVPGPAFVTNKCASKSVPSPFPAGFGTSESCVRSGVTTASALTAAAYASIVPQHPCARSSPLASAVNVYRPFADASNRQMNVALVPASNVIPGAAPPHALGTHSTFNAPGIVKGCSVGVMVCTLLVPRFSTVYRTSKSPAPPASDGFGD